MVVEAVSLGVGLFVVAPPKGVEAVVALRLRLMRSILWSLRLRLLM